MNGCNNCFNNCSQIVSDQCVKYTGPAIAALEIELGDPLSEVTEKLTTYLLSALDASGIEPTIDPADSCALVNDYLTGDTLNDVISAILQAICDLQVQVTADVANMTTLNADYTIGCLTGVTSSSDTHAIVQAIITKLCALNLNVLALQSALSAYVTIADIDTYIQNYLDSIAVTAMYNKMVPYTAIEYYGALTGYPTIADGFNTNGVGYGAWQQVYLCNGLNGTPDKRGRIPVGCTTMGGGAFNINVDPAIPGNPTVYTAPGNIYGTNKVTLSVDEMPTHTHVATSTPNDPGHRHLFVQDDTLAANHGNYTKYSNVLGNISIDQEDQYKSGNYYTKNEVGIDTKASQTTGITVSTVNANRGNSQAHNNVPPVMSCYYIMHIPTP